MLTKRIIHEDFDTPVKTVEEPEIIEESTKSNNNALLIGLAIALIIAIGFFIYQNISENE